MDTMLKSFHRLDTQQRGLRLAHVSRCSMDLMTGEFDLEIRLNYERRETWSRTNLRVNNNITGLDLGQLSTTGIAIGVLLVDQ
jgi:hypothetical protein